MQLYVIRYCLYLVIFDTFWPATYCNIATNCTVNLLLILCSMPAVDHRSEHKPSQRSTCPERIDRRNVPGSVYQQRCVYRVRLDSLSGSKYCSVFAEWKLVGCKKQHIWRHSLWPRQKLFRYCLLCFVSQQQFQSVQNLCFSIVCCKTLIIW